MNKVGIYPGTFDPITKGHIDVIKKSLNIVNKLIIAVSNDFSKNYLKILLTLTSQKVVGDMQKMQSLMIKKDLCLMKVVHLYQDI